MLWGFSAVYNRELYMKVTDKTTHGYSLQFLLTQFGPIVHSEQGNMF